MATVVNTGALRSRLQTLGWQPVNDILAAILSASIPASEIVAYLDALIASPAGLNDQAITGCPAAVATQITTFLRNHNLVDT